MNKYDSRPETYEHIAVVRYYLLDLAMDLLARAHIHDQSKLESPEVEVFDEFTPKLKDSTYGSDEYKEFLVGMGEDLKHHYAANRHHPEHGEADLRWEPIKGYEEAYEVSSLGDVASVSRTVPRKRQGSFEKDAQPLKAQVTPKGYLRVSLSHDGRARNHMVHRLVAEAFVSNPHDKPMVNHKNGVKFDNSVQNLEWVTSSENQCHAYDTGLREPAIRYVVHCSELDLTTFGTEAMERKLKELGYDRAAAGGIWSAMDRQGKHLDLTFTGTLLSEHRRNRMASMNLLDLIEMICDWKAATERHADGDLNKSISVNRDRFGYGDEIEALLRNTIARWSGITR